MAEIQPTTRLGKRKTRGKRLKDNRTVLEQAKDYANLNPAEQREVFVLLMPMIVELLEEYYQNGI